MILIRQQRARVFHERLSSKHRNRETVKKHDAEGGVLLLFRRTFRWA